MTEHPPEAIEDEKRAAAEAAALLVEAGMTVGLGTGSTVAYLLAALGRRGLAIRCVATSPRTELEALRCGLQVEPFGEGTPALDRLDRHDRHDRHDRLDRLDIAIDGADQIDPTGWLVKGGGGAHTREKIVAAAADRFVVIGDSSKPVDALHGRIPVELLAFGIASTRRRCPEIRLRDGPRSPDGGIIGDWDGDLTDLIAAAAALAAIPGIVGNGLFPPAMVHDVLIARGTGIEHRAITR